MEEPKFKVGDLVLWLRLLGKVEEIWSYSGIPGYFYTVGGKVDIPERELTKADWRDVTRITKGGAT